MQTSNIEQPVNATNSCSYNPAVGGPQLHLQQLHEQALEVNASLRDSEQAKVSCYQQIAKREGMEVIFADGDLSFRFTISEETLVSLLEAKLRLISDDDITLDGVMFAVAQSWLETQPGITVQ